MSPKEKAIELVDKYLNYVNCWGDDGNADYEMSFRYAKECASIVVDEILETVKCVSSNEIELDEYYWFEVKQEIEKL